jgi:hypothetical protein
LDTSLVDISTFKKSSDFYGSIDLILTVKNFDLEEIRKRYLKSRDSKSGKAGSVERREPSLGGIISLTLGEGQIHNEQIHCRTSEPRGIDFNHDLLGIATENEVHIIESSGTSYSLKSPWFSYIHTVQFHPFEEQKILISSSGFDLIREYNFMNKNMTFEWLAWEHGFNIAKDPESGKDLLLTRDSELAKVYKERGIDFYLVENPKSDHLPTAKRAAFINSATYNPNDADKILATFFHEGIVYQISKTDNSSTPVLEGLKNPHGGHISGEQLIGTSTSSGEILTKTEAGIKRLSLQNLSGKPEELKNLEWVQNTLSLEQGYLIAIDSNRTSFVIIDPKNKLYDKVSYNSNWAVQDLISGELSSYQKEALSNITIK